MNMGENLKYLITREDVLTSYWVGCPICHKDMAIDRSIPSEKVLEIPRYYDGMRGSGSVTTTRSINDRAYSVFIEHLSEHHSDNEILKWIMWRIVGSERNER